MIGLFVKMNVRSRFILLILLLLLLTQYSAKAQFDCRSMIPAHLTPFKKEFPLLWSAELTYAHGWMNDRTISNGLLILGLDYSYKKHNFYFEGAGKGWKNTLGGTVKNKYGNNYRGLGIFQKSGFGLREGYYNFYGSSLKIKAGFQTMNIGDYFLVDERALGINLKKNFGAFDLNISGASVKKDWARMGIFCGVKYLYNTIKGIEEVPIGEAFGETNFAGAVLTWDPTFNDSKSNDEFSLDEFQEFSEFESEDELSTSEKPKKNFLKQAGLIFYEEFGKGYEEYKFYYGALAKFSMPASLDFKVELLYQQMFKENMVACFLEIDRQFIWKSGHMTKLIAGYISKIEISDSAKFYPTFSNYYMGEVMRMEAIDIPILKASIQHNISGKLKLYIRLRGVQQMESHKIREIDFETGVKILKHIKLTAIFSQINADGLSEDYYLARFEIRAAF